MNKGLNYGNFNASTAMHCMRIGLSPTAIPLTCKESAMLCKDERKITETAEAERSRSRSSVKFVNQ